MFLRRREIASRYNKAFDGIPEIDTPFHGDMGCWEDEKTGKGVNGYSHSWHLYVIKLNLDLLTINRDEFINELKDNGIGTSVHFIPLHIHPYYKKTYGYKPQDFPVAYEVYKRIISIPIYPKMTDDEVGRVIEGVKEVVKKYCK